MSHLKAVIATGVALTALTIGAPGASAADYPLPPPPLIEGGPREAELGSGWYLRGDVGFVDYGKIKENFPYGSGTIPLERLKLDDSWSLGGGVGYKFTNWLRADVTVDWRGESKFSAQNSGSNYVHGYSNDRAKIESTTYLFNAYFDLGNWYGVTPYVGAGVGAAQNAFNKYTAQVTCTTLVCGPVLGPQPATITPSRTTYNLAWALMGGVAIDVGSGFKIDAGYRYVHLGEARTKLDAFGVGTRLEPLDAHEVRVGVRYMID